MGWVLVLESVNRRSCLGFRPIVLGRKNGRSNELTDPNVGKFKGWVGLFGYGAIVMAAAGPL